MNGSTSTPAKRTALFAGSFDPFTIGHKSIVDRGLEIFDEVVIGIGVNMAKPGWMTPDERQEAIRRIYAGNPRVRVITYTDLTVQAAAREGAGFLLRGVRTAQDFEYERQLADINRNLSGVESVLIYALPELAAISSSMVRELSHYGIDITPYLPEPSDGPASSHVSNKE